MIFVDEDAFGPLEESIGRHFPKYLNFGHWGATSIPRDAWLRVLDDWGALKLSLLNGNSFGQTAPARFSLNEVREIAQERLAANVCGLVQLIEELSEWVRQALSTYDHVSIHGI
jgi:hypothetical protein